VNRHRLNAKVGEKRAGKPRSRIIQREKHTIEGGSSETTHLTKNVPGKGGGYGVGCLRGHIKGDGISRKKKIGGVGKNPTGRPLAPRKRFLIGAGQILLHTKIIRIIEKGTQGKRTAPQRHAGNSGSRTGEKSKHEWL